MDKNVIVFDIDGTLALNGDRVNHLYETPKNWDDYFNRCDEDDPNTPIIDIYQQYFFDPRYRVVCVTGRRENTRRKTLEWFERQGMLLSSFDLYMRPDGDFRHDTVVKPELVEKFEDKILMVFEDRNSVVKMWRDMGITCLQVQEGDF